MAKKKRTPPKPKKKRSPPRDRGGDLVRACVVARLLGFDERTVRGYVERKVWSGRIIDAGDERRFYVHRSVVEALRDRGTPDVSIG